MREAQAISGKTGAHGSDGGRPAGRFLVGAVFFLSTLAAAVATAAPAVPALLGYKVMVVTSGSMEPRIGVGDAVLVKPGPSVRVGDVVTFRPIGAHGLTTHRVVSVKELEGETYLQTKGDANDTPDPNLAAARSVVGTVGLTVPWVGRLIHFGTTREGRLLLLGVPALMLVIQQGRALRRAAKPAQAAPGTVPGHPHPRTGAALRLLRAGAVSVALLVALLGTFALIGAEEAVAHYTDSASVPANTFTTTEQFPAP